MDFGTLLALVIVGLGGYTTGYFVGAKTVHDMFAKMLDHKR